MLHRPQLYQSDADRRLRPSLLQAYPRSAEYAPLHWNTQLPSSAVPIQHLLSGSQQSI